MITMKIVTSCILVSVVILKGKKKSDKRIFFSGVPVKCFVKLRRGQATAAICMIMQFLSYAKARGRTSVITEEIRLCTVSRGLGIGLQRLPEEMATTAIHRS